MPKAARWLSVGFQYVLLIFAAFVVLMPPVVIFLNAFKGDLEYAQSGVFDLPASFLHFDNFKVVFERGRLDRAFLNTLFITAVSVAGNVMIGAMVAYAIGRFEFRLKKVLLGAFLLATLIPGITTQVATFSLIRDLGLFNTYGAPILLYLGADVIQIYICLQFIRHIPFDLDEAAMMEGASYFRIFGTIIFPLLAPATATVVILKTIKIYNDMYVPFLYMPSQRLGVVSTSLMRFVGNYSAQWNMLCAAILLILLPTVVLFLFLQRYVFSGIVSGSVK